MDLFALDSPYFFLSARGMISSVTLKVQKLVFCFDRPGAAHFRASANILGRDDFASVGLAMASRQMGKNAKFYPWPIVAWAPLWVLK